MKKLLGANDIRSTYTHYVSDMYGDENGLITYQLNWYSRSGEHRTVYVYEWSDGVNIESPTLDQIMSGIIGVIPDVYNTTEYYEIPEGDTCPVTIAPDPAAIGTFFTDPQSVLR